MSVKHIIETNSTNGKVMICGKIAWSSKQEENSKRIIKELELLNNMIENGKINETHIDLLINNFFSYEISKWDYSKFLEQKDILRKNLYKIKDLLANYYNCSVDELCFEDLEISTDKPSNYKVVFGNAVIHGVEGYENVSNLISLGGNLISDGTKQSLSNLINIGGSIENNISSAKEKPVSIFDETNKHSESNLILNSLEVLGGGCDNQDNTISFPNLKTVGQSIIICDAKCNLEYVGQELVLTSDDKNIISEDALSHLNYVGRVKTPSIIDNIFVNGQFKCGKRIYKYKLLETKQTYLLFGNENGDYFLVYKCKGIHLYQYSIENNNVNKISFKHVYPFESKYDYTSVSKKITYDYIKKEHPLAPSITNYVDKDDSMEKIFGKKLTKKLLDMLDY